MAKLTAELLADCLSGPEPDRPEAERLLPAHPDEAEILGQYIAIARSIPRTRRIPVDPAMRARGRAALLAAISPTGQRFVTRRRSFLESLKDGWWPIGQGQARLDLSGIGLRPVLASSAAAVLLISSSAGAMYAAQDALPGEPLFQMKTAVEELQVGLAPNEEAKAQAYLEIAGRRLVEMQTAAQNGQPAAVDAAAEAFAISVNRIDEHLAKAANRGGDIGSLAGSISESLEQQKADLATVRGQFPERTRALLGLAEETAGWGAASAKTISVEYSGNGGLPIGQSDRDEAAPSAPTATATSPVPTATIASSRQGTDSTGLARLAAPSAISTSSLPAASPPPASSRPASSGPAGGAGPSPATIGDGDGSLAARTDKSPRLAAILSPVSGPKEESQPLALAATSTAGERPPVLVAQSQTLERSVRTLPQAVANGSAQSPRASTETSGRAQPIQSEPDTGVSEPEEGEMARRQEPAVLEGRAGPKPAQASPVASVVPVAKRVQPDTELERRGSQEIERASSASGKPSMAVAPDGRREAEAQDSTADEDGELARAWRLRSQSAPPTAPAVPEAPAARIDDQARRDAMPTVTNPNGAKDKGTDKGAGTAIKPASSPTAAPSNPQRGETKRKDAKPKPTARNTGRK